MGRMHSSGKGRSSSFKPFTTTIPTYMEGTIPEIKSAIIALAKKNQPAARIGATVRDLYGVGNVRDVLGCDLVEFLKKNNCAPAIPSDLECLVTRANAIRKHLSTYKKDNDAKYRLILINSRLHRLVRYYKEKSVLPGNWKPAVTSS